MLHRDCKILLTVLFFLVTGASNTLAAHFEIITGGASEIIFKSKAPMEKFDGKTKQVSGSFDADLSSLVGPVILEVEIDLASFDTGKKKRNKHMRENHLETKKFPKAWFRGEKIISASNPALNAGESVQIVLRGTLDLHGVKHNHNVTLDLTLDNNGVISVKGGFPVLISDHNIKRPKFLVMKLADKQQVVINVKARQGS